MVCKVLRFLRLSSLKYKNSAGNRKYPEKIGGERKNNRRNLALHKLISRGIKRYETSQKKVLISCFGCYSFNDFFNPIQLGFYQRTDVLPLAFFGMR